MIFQPDAGDYHRAFPMKPKPSSRPRNRTPARIAQTDAAQATLATGRRCRQAGCNGCPNATRSRACRKLHDMRFVAQAELTRPSPAGPGALVKRRQRCADRFAKANIEVLNAQYSEAESTVKSLELARDKAASRPVLHELRAPFDGGGQSSGKKRIPPPEDCGASRPPPWSTQPLSQLAASRPAKPCVYLCRRLLTARSSRRRVHRPASGAVFSLLPPENATGNFTSEVQRSRAHHDPEGSAESGKMSARAFSVVVDIDTRTGPEQKAD